MNTRPDHPRSLSELQATMTTLGGRIGLTDVPVFGGPQGDGTPYVEFRDRLHFVVEERGVEIERRETDDPDELLYWLWDGITFSLAMTTELRNRRPNEDPRRQLFAEQEWLLGRLSEPWRARKESDHRLTLSRHPFSDGRP